MELNIQPKFDVKDLPSMAETAADAVRLARDITIGQTLFFKEHNVRTEAEYKKKAMAAGKISKHSHIGWNSWDETARNVEYIYNELARRNSYITRMGFIFDWIMGVPEEYRGRMQPGTGLIFKTEEEWRAIGQIVPIQPHLSDHMIGCPNALENTRMALKAGVTSIGNVSHYFTYEYPGIDLEYKRTADSMTAFALMGQFDGTIVHSNLDDGFGNRFDDLADLAGWAMMERYLVEELLGAAMTFSYGNLFSEPMSRIIFNMAMEATNTRGTPGTMIFGNTIDYGLDLTRNFGALSSFSLADAICQCHRPTGHAVASVPVTEAIRVPSADEIVDGHCCVDMMLEKAALLEPYIDWQKVEREVAALNADGKVFFDRMMNGLDDLGVDLHHAGEIMATLKAIGPEQLERCFGAGPQQADETRRPLYPTDIVKTLARKRAKVEQELGDTAGKLAGLPVIVGSTDIHDYGKNMIRDLCQQAGARVFDLGTYVTPQEIVETVLETESRVVLVSVLNGIALRFATALKEALDAAGLDVAVLMGGLINENMDGESLPRDVSEEVRALGVNCDLEVGGLVEAIREAARED